MFLYKSGLDLITCFKITQTSIICIKKAVIGEWKGHIRKKGKKKKQTEEKEMALDGEKAMSDTDEKTMEEKEVNPYKMILLHSRIFTWMF